MQNERLKNLYEQKFVEDFGHLDPEDKMRVMKMVKDAYNTRGTVDRLHKALGEEFLIVPGNNEISMGQLITAMYNYFLDQDTWDAKIIQWEQENGN